MRMQMLFIQCEVRVNNGDNDKLLQTSMGHEIKYTIQQYIMICRCILNVMYLQRSMWAFLIDKTLFRRQVLPES